MNWIERMYELKGRDLYSQNGEGFYLEYVISKLKIKKELELVDIGGGDGFYLSNTRHCAIIFGTQSLLIDRENGHEINKENACSFFVTYNKNSLVISIDIDGNDYWISRLLLNAYNPAIFLCEFNPAFTDARAIKYNPYHIWDGTDYYGFTFEAAKKLAKEFNYTIIFNLANMNLFMVRNDMIEGLHVPEVTYKVDNFFPHKENAEWIIF